MKKIKVKNIIDIENENIDDIYSNIVKDMEKEVNKLPKETKGNKNIKNKKVINKSKLSNKKDDDLIFSMTKRLNVVESQLKEKNEIIKQKDQEIQKLKSELSKYTSANNNNSEDITCPNCQKYISQLSSQTEYIDKLYTFLKENGITIINSNSKTKDVKSQTELNDKLTKLENDLNEIKNKENEELSSINKPDSNPTNDPELSTPIPQKIDIKIIIQRIGEMNSLINQDGASIDFVSEDGKLFKMAHRKEISITFYQNGILIEGYSFFLYSSQDGQKILRDILDGYFPFILKEKYPKGIELKVSNLVHQVYSNDNKEQKNMTAEQFLDMFPDKVIKNGNILNIKEDMEQYLSSYKSNKEYNLDKDTYCLYDEKEKINIKDIAKLKIKINAIDKIVDLNIKKTDNIKSVFDFIRDYSNQTFAKKKLTLRIKAIQDYVLVMNYPFKLIEIDTKGTIESLGLFPSIFLTFDLLSNYNKK